MKFKKFLEEGVWNQPNTLEKAERLKKLMEKPLKAGKAKKLLYSLMGCDDLYDEIDEVIARLGYDTDIRYLIKDTLSKWIKDRKKWFVKWDEEAIKVIKNIIGGKK